MFALELKIFQSKWCIIPEQAQTIPVQICEFDDYNLLVCVEFISGLETESEMNVLWLTAVLMVGDVCHF